MAQNQCFFEEVRSRMFICCRNVQISASSAARDRIRSTTIQPISLQRSLITPQHRPILDQLLVRLGLRQGQLPWSTEIIALTCGTQNCLRLPSSLLKRPRQACCTTPVQDQKCWNTAAFEQSQFIDHTRFRKYLLTNDALNSSGSVRITPLRCP